MNDTLSVREIKESDIDFITNYWLGSGDEYFTGLGVDLKKIPSKEEWRNMLLEQIKQPFEQKQSYAIIWEINGHPVGHSNINKIIWESEAFMHLHLWNPQERKKGIGTTFVKMTLPYYFEKFKLKKIYSEPYAMNIPPIRVLEKAGFQFVKKYTTIPGWINFEQEVSLWEMTYERFQELQ